VTEGRVGRLLVNRRRLRLQPREPALDVGGEHVGHRVAA
jgi:hypothetical protein